MRLRELDPNGFEEYVTKAKTAALSGHHHDVARILQLHEIVYSKDAAPAPPQSPHAAQVTRKSDTDAVKVTFRPPSRRPPPLDLDVCSGHPGQRMPIPPPRGRHR